MGKPRLLCDLHQCTTSHEPMAYGSRGCVGSGLCGAPAAAHSSGCSWRPAATQKVHLIIGCFPSEERKSYRCPHKCIFALTSVSLLDHRLLSFRGEKEPPSPSQVLLCLITGCFPSEERKSYHCPHKCIFALTSLPSQVHLCLHACFLNSLKALWAKKKGLFPHEELQTKPANAGAQ